MGEIWKKIPGYKSIFEVSSLGRVRTVIAGNANLRKVPCPRGYGIVGIERADGYKTSVNVHRLVYIAFIGSVPEGFEVDHIDDNRTNNVPENLKAISKKENLLKSWARRRASGYRARNQYSKKESA